MFLTRTWIIVHRRLSIRTVAAWGYDARKTRALAHWRRHALLVGKMALFFEDLHTEVCFRPGNSGFCYAQREFEKTGESLEVPATN